MSLLLLLSLLKMRFWERRSHSLLEVALSLSLSLLNVRCRDRTHSLLEVACYLLLPSLSLRCPERSYSLLGSAWSLLLNVRGLGRCHSLAGSLFC